MVKDMKLYRLGIVVLVVLGMLGISACSPEGSWNERLILKADRDSLDTSDSTNSEEMDGDLPQELQLEQEEEQDNTIPDGGTLVLVRSMVDGFEVFAVRLSIEIEHPKAEQLGISITSPSGTVFWIKRPGGIHTEDFATSIDVYAFAGENSEGDWIVRVSDFFEGAEGRVVSWSLDFIGPPQVDGDDVESEMELQQDMEEEGWVAIPDHSEAGVEFWFEVQDQFEVFAVLLHMEFRHTFEGDIEISLRSPSGRDVVVWRSTHQIDTHIPDPIVSTEFAGEPSAGVWTVTVRDTVEGDEGFVRFLGGEVLPAGADVDIEEDIESLEEGSYEEEPSGIEIPDDDPSGVVFEYEFEDSGLVSHASVVIDYYHPRQADVAVYLTSPSGRTVRALPEEITEAGIRYGSDAFDGMDAVGLWKCKVADLRAGEVGFVRNIEFEISLQPQSDGDEEIVADTESDLDAEEDVAMTELDSDEAEADDSNSDVELDDGRLWIPDNDPVGLHLSVRTDRMYAGFICIALDIVHTFPGDLSASLVSPNGDTVELFGFDPSRSYPDMHFETVVTSMVHTEAVGNWSLVVRDLVEGDVGYVESYSVEFGCDVEVEYENELESEEDGEGEQSDGDGVDMDMEGDEILESELEYDEVDSEEMEAELESVDGETESESELEIELDEIEGETFDFEDLGEELESELELEAEEIEPEVEEEYVGNGTCAEPYLLEVPSRTDFEFSADAQSVLTPPASCAGWTLDGEESVIAFDITELKPYIFSVTSEGDYGIYILKDCMQDWTCMVGADKAGAGEPETIRWIPENTGRYYLVVDSVAGSGHYPFSVLVTSCLKETFASGDTPKEIPDMSTTTSSIMVPFGFDISKLSVGFDITADYSRDIEVRLQAPWGEEYLLRRRTSSTSLNQEVKMWKLHGNNAAGIWTLVVKDAASPGEGVLNGWYLRFYCEPEVDGCDMDADPAPCTDDDAHNMNNVPCRAVEVELPATVSGNVCRERLIRETYEDWYSFWAYAGDRITLSLEFEEDANLDLYVYRDPSNIYDPDYTAAGTDNPEQISFTSYGEAYYWVRVRNFVRNSDRAYTLVMDVEHPQVDGDSDEEEPPDLSVEGCDPEAEPGVCIPDQFDNQNNVPCRAAFVQLPFSMQDGHVCKQDYSNYTQDWFAFWLDAGQTVTATVSFDPSYDIDIYLYDDPSSEYGYLESEAGVSSPEVLTYTVEESRIYWLRVKPFSSVDIPYDIEIDVSY